MYPTCVGMNRLHQLTLRLFYHVPHMRGDEPEKLIYNPQGLRNVPHMRGDEPRALKHL